MEDQRPETLKHIKNVKQMLKKINEELYYRGRIHDSSKLKSPEQEIFDEYTPKLKNTTYGSEKYKQYLKEMSVALDHHYDNNRHHPEHFSKRWKCDNCNEEYNYSPTECQICSHVNCFTRMGNTTGMNLVDIIEMLCDWKAATLRHADGNLLKSIEINKKRFKMSDELESILLNTVELLDK
jgi:hypothetical protein